MTDEVGELVLDNNRAQTLALLIARTQGLPMVNVHARYIDLLEREGWLDRELKFLPTDKQIAERQSNGSGLRTPEFAVMIAYTKNANIAEILKTDLPDVRLMQADVVNYFPTPLREKYREYIGGHRLRREIAATTLTNQMVNLSGISYDHRMTEDTGASVADVSRAWLVAARCSASPTGGMRSQHWKGSRSKTDSSCSSTVAALPSVARCGSSGIVVPLSTSSTRCLGSESRSGPSLRISVGS